MNPSEAEYRLGSSVADPRPVQDEGRSREAAPSAASGSPPLRRLLDSLAPYLVAMAGSIAAATHAYRLWEARPGVPFSYGGDALPVSMHMRQMVENGSIWNDSRLGAPIGQHFQDWPVPDVLHLLVARALSVFSSNWAAVLNGVFLLGFPLAALIACWVLRQWGISRWVAAVLGILYSILPYHVIRGEDHLFLSGYYAVPLGAWLAVSVMSGVTLFSRQAPARSLRTVAFCVLVAMSGVYYAAFTLVFLAAAMLARFASDRRLRDLVPGVLLCFLLVGVVLVDTAPTLLYHRAHGENPVSGNRYPHESDLYGLKVAQMLLPAHGHRVKAVDEFQSEYYEEFPLPSEGGAQALGVVGSVGLLYLFGVAATGFSRRRQSIADDRPAQFAGLVIAGALVATIGGLATWIGLLFSARIRSWNRISVYLAVFALAAVGILLDRTARTSADRKRRRLLPALAVAVLAVGFLDQTSPYWTPPYDAINEEFSADRAYFSEIEQRLPRGAAVFELPSLPFPEGPPAGILPAYELLKPYLHTRHVRWSFGGVKGRIESAWQSRLPAPDHPTFVHDLVASGFEGLYIDRHGYIAPDTGVSTASKIEAVVRQQLGQEPFASPSGRRAFYDLRGLRDRLLAVSGRELRERRAELLHPVYFNPEGQFYGPEPDGDRWRWWAIGPRAEVAVLDGTGSKERSRVDFDLYPATSTPAEFRITWPDGTKDTVRTAGKQPVRVSKVLTTKRGRSALRIESDAQRLPTNVDSRELHFFLLGATIGPA